MSLLRGGEPAGLGERGEDRELLSLAVGGLPRVPRRNDPADAPERDGQPADVSLIRAGQRPAGARYHDGDGRLRSALQR